MNAKYNKVIVVDENDNPVGAEYMPDAIEKGLIRRVVRVYIFNESGQLLIQQRSARVYKPLLLDQSAAGHVDEGETSLHAAYRELKEELGLDNVTLTLVEASIKTIDCYAAVFKAIVPDDTTIDYDKREIEQVMWYTPEQLTQDVTNTPDIFTPAFVKTWSLLGEKIVQTTQQI